MQVSVIIPSYNHRDYVLQAIDSVLNQSWPDIDLIVIDDGSTDGSAELISRHHQTAGGYTFVARENRGAIATFNEGVERAVGQALCILASDDFLPAESIRIRAERLLEKSNMVAVFADGEAVEESTGERCKMMTPKRKQIFQAEDPVPLFLQGVNLFIHTMLVRTDIFRKIGAFDKRYQKCEDLDVQLLLFLEGEVGYVDQPVYCYRGHGLNVSSVNRDIARLDKVLCFEKYRNEIPALRNYRRLIEKQLCRHYLRLGRYLARTGNQDPRELAVFKGARRFIWREPRMLWYLLKVVD